MHAKVLCNCNKHPSMCLTLTMILVGSFEIFSELCRLRTQNLNMWSYQGITAAVQQEPLNPLLQM